MSCVARREGDEMVCTSCRLRWDAKEAPPSCRASLFIEAHKTRASEVPRYASGLPFLDVDSKRRA